MREFLVPRRRTTRSVPEPGGRKYDRLRKLVCRILRGKGYTVLHAPSGNDALKISKSHKGPIPLLLTDVIMPGLSGRETAEKLTSQRPETRVLYMSGYTDDAIVRHGVLEEGVHFLPKPFSPEGLARKVREVIGSRKASMIPLKVYSDEEIEG